MKEPIHGSYQPHVKFHLLTATCPPPPLNTVLCWSEHRHVHITERRGSKAKDSSEQECGAFMFSQVTVTFKYDEQVSEHMRRPDGSSVIIACGRVTLQKLHRVDSKDAHDRKTRWESWHDEISNGVIHTIDCTWRNKHSNKQEMLSKV